MKEVVLNVVYIPREFGCAGGRCRRRIGVSVDDCKESVFDNRFNLRIAQQSIKIFYSLFVSTADEIDPSCKLGKEALHDYDVEAALDVAFQDYNLAVWPV